ncbi:MAG TPA: leukotoxin LktA family filamentous adhesin, partial [Rhodocyclaceae bacterium]|nr:leukotoxin LktA family filamentous adhesin [Rhodocyclaceae bacterium]
MTNRAPVPSRLPPWRRSVAVVLAALQVLYPAAAAAGAGTVILPDGRTATVVGSAGNVYSVSTGTVSGANAFNSFNGFSVGAGDTVNLLVPASAINLINIVRDQRTDIYGILNGIKDGRIGGNVWFANAHGFVVGKTGVVNVGSLTVTTPTQRFVDEFFRAPGVPDEGSVSLLLGGKAPRNPDGRVTVEGRVNAEGRITLHGGLIDVAGVLYSGARFAGRAPDFTDVVNANGLAAGTTVVVREGRIEIVADGDVSLSGVVAAPGGPGVRGGDISVQAGGNVDLASGAMVLAWGSGKRSAGGTVNIHAAGDAVIRTGALVDASAGDSGDGGAIEFSAARRVELAGGQFRAEARRGSRGTVLIDPDTVEISSDFYGGGADHTIVADKSIIVDAGVTISTRNVAAGAAADQDTALSVGNSGSLSLAAPDITLQSGSRLLAHATPGFSAGNITLSATRTGGELDFLADTIARISLTGATVKGRNVTLAAVADHASSVSPVVAKSVGALVDVDSSVILAQGGALAVRATATTNTATGAVPIAAALQTIDSRAAVDVRGGSSLTTTT